MPVPLSKQSPAQLASTASDAAEEIFLTPRVLDRRAFEDYSESLKRLIRDAAGEGQSLSRTAADLRVLKDQLTGATLEAQKRLDAAMRAVPTPEPRPIDAPPATKANGRARHTDPVRPPASPDPALSTETIAALQARIESQLEAKVNARLDAHLARLADERANAAPTPSADSRALDAMEARLHAEASAIAERVQNAVAEQIARMELEHRAAIGAMDRAAQSLAERARLETAQLNSQAAADHAARIESSIALALDAATRRLTAQADEQATRLRETTRESIDQARQECEAAVRQITTGASLRVRKAQQDVDALLDSLDASAAERLSALRAGFDQSLADLTNQSHERAAWIKAALADLSALNGPRLADLRSLLEQAAHQTNPDHADSLAAATLRAEILRQGVHDNLEQVQELAKQVALMRDLLARSILEGVTRVDELDARQEELLVSAARAIEQFGQEIQTLRNAATPPVPQAQPASTHSHDAAPTADALGALSTVEDRLASLRTQTDEAGRTAQWLATLIDKAAATGITLDAELAVSPPPNSPRANNKAPRA